MRCDEFRDHLDSYLDEDLDETNRHRWRQHLRSCAECRRWAISVEPTLLFTTTEPVEASAEQVQACVARVSGLIRNEELERRLRPRGRWWLAAAAAVLLLIGGGLILRLMPAAPGVVPDAPAATAESDVEVVPPPEVEVDMKGEGVEIYRFASDEDENTAVVYVVNPALES